MERYLENYTFCTKRQCVREEEDDILLNVEVDAIVYAYCQNGVPSDDVPLYDSSIHGTPVYVGQTIQEIVTRDKQHLSSTTTPFDRQYTDRTQYTLVILCRRKFAPATSLSAFRDDTLRPAAEWMDVKEKHFISHFDTYHNGWNSTQGGQGRGWLVTMREAKAKANAKRFETVYMPAFRAYHKEHGHPNAPRSHDVLGILLNHLRSGHTSIPLQYEDELMGMGLDLRNQMIVKRDEIWEVKYMPAFRAYHKEHGHPNAPRSHDVLGILLDSIRSSNTSIPLQYEDELMGMGLDLRNQMIVKRDEIWEVKYMPAFRAYHKEHGHPNAPRSHDVLGILLDSIRSSNTSIPLQYEDELMGMGLDLRNQMIVKRDEIWEVKYMPAFRAYHKEHGHPNAPRSHDVLGILLIHLRSGHTSIPPQYKDMINNWGFFWCTQNLARHVSRMLGRTVVSLDNDAQARGAVANAAAHHAALLALRSLCTKEVRSVASVYRVPLGNRGIGDGIARFYADVERMQAAVKECVSQPIVHAQ